MRVVALRRYPVKSMGGEAIEVARLDQRGIAGDRWFAVEDDDGHFASGKNTRRFRRRDRVFDYSARTTPSGQVVVSDPRMEWTVGDDDLDLHLSTVMGCPVRVNPEARVPHQDAGAVSLIGAASLRWCAERWGLNPDPRRLRVNVVFESDEPFIEESWVGRTIRVGSARLRVVERTPRCRMIDIAQDGAAPTGKWLTPLASERSMQLAVYADVAIPGEFSLGEHLEPQGRLDRLSS